MSFAATAIPHFPKHMESRNAFYTAYVRVSCELDRTTKATLSSGMENQLSQYPSLASSCSTAVPECSSTQCNTPVNAVLAAAPADLHRVTPLDGYGMHVANVYKRAAEDQEMRARIAENAKHVFHALTGFNVDEIFDLLFVKEAWFSAEVVIHALCLVNRLSFRFPHWYEHAIESDTDVSSYTNSPIRGGAAVLARCGGLPHLCSSTSSDFSHQDNIDMLSDGSLDMGSSPHVRSSNGSVNSLGEVFTRSNSPRCMMALLLLSSKFHGDIVYSTSSLSNAVNKFREEQIKTMADASVSLSSGPRRKPLLRVLPATLGQCEKRLFRELGCTVFVHKDEYQHCEDLVLRRL